MDAGTAAMMGGAAGLMTGVLLAEATQPHYGYGWYGPSCGPTVIGERGAGRVSAGFTSCSVCLLNAVAMCFVDPVGLPPCPALG